MKVQTKQEASSIGPDRKSFKRKTENTFLSIDGGSDVMTYTTFINKLTLKK